LVTENHAMTQPDLIIFDCDGVLVDSEVLSCRCLSKVLAGYGIDLGLDQALDLFLGRSMTAVVEHYEALGRSIPEQFSTELTAGFVPRSLPRFARLKA
jgi:beta-phosphoglucomutase-like phosphatase (HAD superfamily)